MAQPQSGSSTTVSRSNWNSRMLDFVKGGKPEYPEKNPRSRDENQQQTQPAYDSESGNRTRATLVGGAIPIWDATPSKGYPWQYMSPAPKFIHLPREFLI